MAHRSQVQSFLENVTLVASRSITPSSTRKLTESGRLNMKTLTSCSSCEILRSGTVVKGIQPDWGLSNSHGMSYLMPLGGMAPLDDVMTTFLTWVYHHIYLWAIQETNTCIEPMDHPHHHMPPLNQDLVPDIIETARSLVWAQSILAKVTEEAVEMLEDDDWWKWRSIVY